MIQGYLRIKRLIHMWRHFLQSLRNDIKKHDLLFLLLCTVEERRREQQDTRLDIALLPDRSSAPLSSTTPVFRTWSRDTPAHGQHSHHQSSSLIISVSDYTFNNRESREFKRQENDGNDQLNSHQPGEGFAGIRFGTNSQEMKNINMKLCWLLLCWFIWSVQEIST